MGRAHPINYSGRAHPSLKPVAYVLFFFRENFLVLLLSEAWFLETLRSHSFILVSAYNFSADQTAT